MGLISKFDPWRSKLCSCPPKLTFNPYTGCDHACVYCYASSYIPKFFFCRPKNDLISKLRIEAERLKGELISMANSSDPYPNLEAKMGLTRQCLEILIKHNCKLQIITKSTTIIRDVDLLKKKPSMVSLTITTMDDEIAKLIEPHAPPPAERLKTAEALVDKGIPTSVRIDPIIPFVNEDQENLIKTLASINIQHITVSTYKVKPDNWQRLSIALPKASEKLKPLYFEKGEKFGGYIYLPKSLRLEMMKKMRLTAEKYGIKFGTCREGLSHLNTASCDGSWLLY
ncbi:MAG: radical SAM protein [Candidatus Bathycorpusculaceae bacterium]